MILASVREILGMGTFIGHQVVFGNFRPWVIMLTPPGAFLTLGLLLGLVNIIDKVIKVKKEKNSK
jgi:electron transport complex protein RnfE